MRTSPRVVRTAVSALIATLEVGFRSGTLAPGASTGEIQARFNRTDWTPLTRADDVSAYLDGRPVR